MAEPPDITIVQGGTFRINWIWSAQRLDANGAPVFEADGVTPVLDPQPLDGYTAIMRVFTAKEDELVLTADSADEGGITLQPNGTIGLIQVRIGADKTMAVTKSGYFNVQLVDQDDPTEVIPLVAARTEVDKSMLPVPP